MKKLAIIIIAVAVTPAAFAQTNRQGTRPQQGNRENQIVVVEQPRNDAMLLPTEERYELKDLLYTEDYLRKFRTYITREVRMTTREARNFFELYEELQDKKHKLNHEIILAQYKLANGRITDREALRIIDRMADIELEIAKLDKTYLTKYKKILNPTVILMIKVAEEEFQEQYLEDIQRRRYQQNTPVYSTMPVTPKAEQQTPERIVRPQTNNRRSR